MSLLPRRAARRLAVILAVLLLATSANTASAAVTWRTAGTFTEPPVGFARTAANGAAWRHVLLRDRWGNVFHRRQPAAGGAWTARRLLGPGPTTRRAAGASIASTGTDLHVAWIERGGTEGAPSQSYWVAWRGNDAHGAADRWRPVRVVASGYGSTRGTSLAASGDHVVVAWSAFSYRSATSEIWYAETFDGGASWSTGSIGPGSDPVVAIGHLGVLVVYELGSWPDLRLEAVRRERGSWSRPLILAESPTMGFDAAMAGDRAAVTWATGQGVFVRVLHRAGWDTPVRIARPVADPPPEGYVQPSPEFPTIALQGSTRIGVAWSLPRPYWDIDDEIFTVNDVWWRETADGVRWAAARRAYAGAGNETRGGSVVAARWAGSTQREVLVSQQQYWNRDAPRGVVRVGLGSP